LVADNHDRETSRWFSLAVAAYLTVQGSALVWYDAIYLSGSAPYLLGAGLAMMGLVPGSVFDFFRKRNGGGS
jgi:hypothetical protein